MANTAAVYARIDPKLKEDVDAILEKLQVTPSSLIQMLYAQIKLTNGIPFEVKLPRLNPVCIEDLTEDELNQELHKGYDDAMKGKCRSNDEVKRLLAKEFGLE
jgi:addiction module RelB/DinJ family antitoxin